MTWSRSCRDCDLIKVVTEDTVTSVNESIDDLDMQVCRIALGFFIHHDEVDYGHSYDFVKLGFSPQCLCNSMDCYTHEVTYPYFKELNDLPKKLFYFQYLLGFLLVCINMVIVVVVLHTRSLRTSASFILICSMALSDTLIGMYTIGIAIFNPFTAVTVTPIEMMQNDNSACPYLGFVFTTGQTTTVLTSLVLTIERYLAIVHCDKPAMRMTAKFTLLLSLAIWLVGALFALLPSFGVKEMQYHKWFQCTMPFHKSPGTLEDTSTITLLIAVGFVLIYLASIALYFRIFMFVRAARANFSVGVQREARLAKRIAVVVGTNLFFFVVPTVLFLVYVYRFTSILMDVTESLASFQGFIIACSWLPVTLLGINSLLNPILYAFRHQRFKKEIRRLSQSSKIRRTNSSVRSPPPEGRSGLLHKDNDEATLELELSKYPSHKD